MLSSKGNAKLPGIMALGYIAAFSETLALAVIVSKGVAPLKDVSYRKHCRSFDILFVLARRI